MRRRHEAEDLEPDPRRSAWVKQAAGRIRKRHRPKSAEQVRNEHAAIRAGREYLPDGRLDVEGIDPEQRVVRLSDRRRR